MFRKIAIGLVCLVLVAAGFAYVAYGSIARAGSGYAAKNICSGYYLSGFSPEVMTDEALRGASEILTYVSADIDPDKRRVTTSLYGLFERHAIYTPGIGCTLLPPGEDEAAMPVQALSQLSVPSDIAWPQGSAPAQANAAIAPLLEEAFAEEDAQRPRNTKAIVVVHQGEVIAERYAEGVSPRRP